jgi:hypothetical protein
MLDKFQEQSILAAVENLEESIAQIECAIADIKNLNPTLFNYPREAKYTSGKFDPTIVEKDNADT